MNLSDSMDTNQVQTKRLTQMSELDKRIEWPDNVWMGVSVENCDYSYRIDHLRQTHARIKFISLEPLLGPLPELELQGINWVIIGGESGPGVRLVERSWILSIRDQYQNAGAPFFFKQWGGVNKKIAGRELEGRLWDELPAMAAKV